MIRRSAMLLAIVVLVAACDQGTPSQTSRPVDSRTPAPSGPVALTVFAAASLEAAVADAATAFAATKPGTTITVSTGSSAALETQIEQGAQADVFLSADTASARKLQDAGLALGTAVIFAGNKLAIVVPKDNPGEVTTPSDLGKAGLRIIAAGDEVPITKYANQLVANLAAQPGSSPDLVAAYNANIVSREDSVTAVIAKIELGEGDAAIVYLTDAKGSDKVRTVDIPDAANIAAAYAGVVVKTSASGDAAQAFLDWFSGPDGQAILARYGFLTPPG